jgi:glutathione S-transferase
MRKLVFSDGSPFARKVRIILAEKRLEFEADIVTDYLRTSDSLKEHNPLLQVPTLYDRGRAIWGSDLILHYPETPSNGAADRPRINDFGFRR